MSEPQPKLYFAHPLSTHDTPIEKAALVTLQTLFPNHRIINPCEGGHQRLGRRNFDYTRQLVEGSDCLVYLPFANGTIDKSIRKEAAVMFAKHGAVHELHVDSDGLPIGMCSRVPDIDPERIIGTEEPRRHRKPYALQSQPPLGR